MFGGHNRERGFGENPYDAQAEPTLELLCESEAHFLRYRNKKRGLSQDSQFGWYRRDNRSLIAR